MALPNLIRRIFGSPAVRRSETALPGWRGEDGWTSRGSVSAGVAPTARQARRAVESNAWASNGVAAIVTAAVSYGATATSTHDDDETRRVLNTRFASWAGACDADGLTSFGGMQAAIVRSLVILGEAFVQQIDTPDGLRLRLIPAEMVDASLSRDFGEGRYVVNGVEFNADGRRVAYHVSRSRPGDLFGSYSPPVRLPAEDILHVFMPTFPGQVRGVSWLAPILPRLNDLDQLEEALLVGARISAMHAGFLKDQNGTGSQIYEGSQVGSILETGLEPGTLKVLPAGFDISFSSPAQAQQSIEFAQLELRAVAAGLGVPEHLLTGDLRGANYSSLRAAMVAFRQRIEAIQYNVLVPKFFDPIWRRFILHETLAGRLDVDEPGGCDWHFPPQPWVDPAKDVQAVKEMIEARLMSRRQAVASLGYAVEDLDAEIAADLARERRLFGEVPADA